MKVDVVACAVMQTQNLKCVYFAQITDWDRKVKVKD